MPTTEPETNQSTNPRPWPSPNLHLSTNRIFALLIAVDHHDMPGANLGGCVKDSMAVEKYLRQSTSEADKKLHLLKLRSPLDSMKDKMEVDAPSPASDATGLPTRAEIIEAFTGFLSQAGADDVVFVHYSGHGSFETRPEQLWHLDPDGDDKHRAETLICRDSFTNKDGKYVPALRDKELRWLIAKVAEKNPHIVMTMDCCNSSGNTRFKENGTAARFNDPIIDEDGNGINSYVFYQKDVQAKNLLDTNPTAYQIPEGQHISLHACHSYELAKEKNFTEGRHGVFTYFLLQTLRATKGNITYRDLMKLVRTKVAESVVRQSPQWQSTNSADVEKVFLGGSASSASAAYTLTPGKSAGEAIVDAGSLHGLLPTSEGDTFFTVFESNKEIWEIDTTTARQAKLKTLDAEQSVLTFVDGQPFPADTTLLKTILKASPLTKTKICIEFEFEEQLMEESEITDAGTKERFKQTKRALAAQIQANPHLQLIEKADGGWQYRLFVYIFQGVEKLRIAEKDEEKALVQPKMGWGADVTKAIVGELEHIAKWNQTLNLKKTDNPIIRPGEVTLEAIDEQGNIIENHAGEIILKATPNGVQNPQLKFKAVLHNHDQVPLYCALLYLRSDFGVDPNFFPGDAHLGRVEFIDGSSRIKREQFEIYGGSHIVMPNGRSNPKGLYLQFTLPNSKNGMQIEEDVCHFKLIVSTEEFDALHLWQSNLEAPSTTRAGRKAKVKSELDSLMQTVQTGGASWVTASAEPPQKITDWYTTMITVRTKRS